MYKRPNLAAGTSLICNQSQRAFKYYNILLIGVVGIWNENSVVYEIEQRLLTMNPQLKKQEKKPTVVICQFRKINGNVYRFSNLSHLSVFSN